MLDNKEFFRYILVGCFNTLVGSIIIIYLSYVGLLPELSNFFGCFFVIFISYFLNRKYTFRSETNYKKNFTKFILSMLIAYILNLFTFEFSYRILNFNLCLSQIYAVLVYTFTGYFLSKKWVFSKLVCHQELSLYEILLYRFEG